MRRVLAIYERNVGPENLNLATAINNLGQLLQATNRLSEAEPLLRRALAIDEKSLGLEHPNVARDLSNLAQLLQSTGRYAEAEPLLRRALAIDERSLGPEHPSVARDVDSLGPLAFGAGSALAVLRWTSRSRPNLPRCAGLPTDACERSMQPYKSNGFLARLETLVGSTLG